MESKPAPQTTPVTSVSSVKTAVLTPKLTNAKPNVKDTAMSPGGPPLPPAAAPSLAGAPATAATATATAAEGERTELLGSLTTQQQQRTSARVIKKLRLEPQLERDKRDSITECESPAKIEDKEPHKFPSGVKQRMPKALWSTDEKNLFFEALNEYGKDFDAITAYICAKMKKKGMADSNLKTKTQVSHFYYRTWHKLSKHVHFDENVKKVAQELYALINYGELRKKLVSVNEKTCARLSEMVLGGSMMVRARGRNLRVRTPMCRALRRLNQISELVCGVRVWSRAQVVLRARDACAWARVQAAAHNPRAAVALPLRAPLADLIHALHNRWTRRTKTKNVARHLENNAEPNCAEDIQNKEMEDHIQEETRQNFMEERDDHAEDLESHLNLETDRIIVQELKLPQRPVLHLGPRPAAVIHLPVLTPSEQLSTQKICFSSYLERMGSNRAKLDGGADSAKLRTPKRQRKDSTTDREIEQKKIKIEDNEPKLVDIDETAVDGIELMANFKNNLEDDEKPSTEDEKDAKADETADDEPERDKDMSEREKDSFSEMEDDEKYNKSDSDNESDHGKTEKGGKQKFKNLKVKFRIRPKKRGGSMYTLVTEPTEPQEPPDESKPEEPSKEGDTKPDFDVDMAVKQIRKGWSVYDAGYLTVGDLYLMFGSRSKLELDYWWAEPTPPLPQPILKSQKIEPEKTPVPSDKDRVIDKKEKQDKTPDKCDYIGDEEKDKNRESDTDIFSPKNVSGQDSNDGLSGDERKGEQLASPEHKSGTSMKLAAKLVNTPLGGDPCRPRLATSAGFHLLSDRLKRLLALAGNAHVAPNGTATTATNINANTTTTANTANTVANAAAAPCHCGHVCSQLMKQKPQQSSMAKLEELDNVFRHPTPLAPKPESEPQRALDLDDLPKWHRGRPRTKDKRVIVQRLLPLLPKLPPLNKLIPVKMTPNSPTALPRILPKPSAATSESSITYVLSQSNGQYFYHDGDRRIPLTSLSELETDNGPDEDGTDDDDKKDTKIATDTEPQARAIGVAEETNGIKKNDKIEKPNNADIANFLPSESMSLSPSRLLRDSDVWLEGSVQDFSLSSFLGHLEGRQQPDLAVESHLQSLMAESSVDYVAKFADLAAEVTSEVNPLSDQLT